MYKLIITHIEFPRNGDGKKILFAGLHDGERFIEIQCRREEDEFLLGNLYIGRVQNIDQNLDAAFIDIGIGANCYMPLSGGAAFLFTHKNGKAPLNIGDELVVQVVKDAIKTKPPCVSAALNFTGSYAVLSTDRGGGIGISEKIRGEKRKQLKEAVKHMAHPEYSWILRTNSANVETDVLLSEMELLRERYVRLKSTAVHKTLFSCLFHNNDFVLDFIRRTDRRGLSQVLTDDRELFFRLNDFFREDEAFGPYLALYGDDSYPLPKLYSIETELEQALRRKVWLKSGAYLLIEPTEALTVIDVNSGKHNVRKKQEDYFLKINLEAAREIAKQLRIRNISGICIVDFIDMPKAQQEVLMREFGRYLSQDPVPSALVDLTALHLAELTRKKIYPPLRQQIGG